MMSAFYVYWNTIVCKVRIHRSECGACKGGGINAGRGKTHEWVSAVTYAEALALAADLKRAHPQLNRLRGRINCGLCHPSRNSP
jgi:hypothetical protein